MTAKWIQYRERCEELEAELQLLKAPHAIASEETLKWLLNSGEVFIRAARVIIEMQLTTPRGQA
jgi:hypothetical protein